VTTGGWRIALAGIAGGLALAATAAAATLAPQNPDPPTVFACVNSHGEVTIVGPHDLCKPKEMSEHWETQSRIAPPGPSERLEAAEELGGRPCATPGGPAGMIVEVRHYRSRRAPTLRCRVPGGRFIDHGDLTLTDTTTGLTWEKKIEGGSSGATCLTEPHGVNSTCTWNQAMDDWLDVLNGWCDSCAGRGSFAGYSDWRLPTLDELLAILDTSRIPAIDPVFGPTGAGYYWSDFTSDLTDAPVRTPTAACVHFADGTMAEITTGNPLRVRAVRGAP
jgi:hypothetical protein